jgi:hypothetical protein
VGSVIDARPDAAVDWAGIAIFRPVRAGNAFEEAVERILQAVKLGVFPPGSRLQSRRRSAEGRAPADGKFIQTPSSGGASGSIS